MYKNVAYLQEDIDDNSSYYKYKYEDTNFNKVLKIEINNVAASPETISITIADNILSFMYDEYKYSKECPFANIKLFLLNRNKNMITNAILYQTEFYLKHRKMIDKIINSINAIESWKNYYYNTGVYGNSSTAYQAYTYTYTASTAYPQYNIYVDYLY